MKTKHVAGLIAIMTLAGAVAAAAVEAEHLDADAQNAVQRFQQASPRIQRLFTEAYGYAVFPTVGKGAIGIGGAEGRGVVYERGAPVGTAKLTQATIGAQLGAQAYSEVIFFESEKALADFKDGKTAISAALSATVAADGAGAEAKYQHGTLVYTMQRSGLMFEASVGGQHFSFMPMSSTSTPASSPAPGAIQSAPVTPPAPPSDTPAAPAMPPAQPPAQ